MIIGWEILIIIFSIAAVIIGHLVISWFSGPDDDNSCQVENLGFSTDNSGILDKHEFVTIGTFTKYAGVSIFLCTLVAIFVVVNELYFGMLINWFICIMVISFAYGHVISGNVANMDDYLSNKVQRLWLAVAFLRPGFIGRLERQNKCCGWFNVFDYCSKDAMSKIMYDMTMANSIRDFFDSVESQRSTDTLYDDYDNYDNEGKKNYGMDINQQPETCDELNGNCVCYQIGTTGEDVHFADMECRRDCDGEMVTVRDGCIQQADFYGDQICYLTGCGDTILYKGHNLLLLLGITAGIMLVSYTIAVYFKLILVYHYWQKYKELYNLQDVPDGIDGVKAKRWKSYVEYEWSGLKDGVVKLKDGATSAPRTAWSNINSFLSKSDNTAAINNDNVFAESDKPETSKLITPTDRLLTDSLDELSRSTQFFSQCDKTAMDTGSVQIVRRKSPDVTKLVSPAGTVIWTRNLDNRIMMDIKSPTDKK